MKTIFYMLLCCLLSLNACVCKSNDTDNDLEIEKLQALEDYYFYSEDVINNLINRNLEYWHDTLYYESSDYMKAYEKLIALGYTGDYD